MTANRSTPETTDHPLKPELPERPGAPAFTPKERAEVEEHYDEPRIAARHASAYSQALAVSRFSDPGTKETLQPIVKSWSDLPTTMCMVQILEYDRDVLRYDLAVLQRQLDARIRRAMELAEENDRMSRTLAAQDEKIEELITERDNKTSTIMGLNFRLAGAQHQIDKLTAVNNTLTEGAVALADIVGEQNKKLRADDPA